MPERTIAVVGTDRRQAAAARALAAAGCRVGGPEAVPAADYILLPVPLRMDEALAALLRTAKPGAVLLGGRAPAETFGRVWVDCFAREELAVRNAVPTAEGCIALLLTRRTRTLWGAPVLVTGYGRVGQALALRLAALGARVTVAARSGAQRALAASQGAEAVPLAELAGAASGFDAVVNTIPAPVLTRPVLAALRPQSLIVDLASAPGGTDFAAAAALGHTAVLASGLPARCAPDSAGAYLAGTVLEVIGEREAVG